MENKNKLEFLRENFCCCSICNNIQKCDPFTCSIINQKELAINIIGLEEFE